MEPRIQYVTTEEGVALAYWTLGEGDPLVMSPPLGYSHIQLEWRDPMLRRWYERLANSRQVVRFDPRGFGLSQRDVTDFSLDTLALDLEQLVDHLELDEFSLYATGGWIPIAIALAARQPGRVSRLIVLHEGWSRSGASRDRILEALRSTDWELYTEVLGHEFAGWSRGEVGHAFARFLRACTTQETMVRFHEQDSARDVTDLLPAVLAQTLILYHPRTESFDSVRSLTAAIPHARLTALEQDAPSPHFLESGMAIVDSFLAEGDEPQVATSPSKSTGQPSGTAVILFADIVDSTALTERMGDAAFRARARELDTALRAIIRDNAGTPIEGKLLGDGVLAVFTSARQAIEAALACGLAGDDGGLPLHLGMHAGDVIREDDPDGRSNVYGGAVNIASRISGLSAPGEVLVSETVRSLARTSAGVTFEDRGEQALKGIGEPVRVYGVSSRE